VTDLYRNKIKHWENNDVHLFTIASTIPEDYFEFLTINGLKADKMSAGLYSLDGSATYRHYLIALNELDLNIRNELILFFSSKYHNKMDEIISNKEDSFTLFLLQKLYQKERKKMKFKIKDEDLANRDIRKVISQLPLDWRLDGLKAEDRLKGLSPKEILEGLKPEDLKKLKQLLDKINLN